MNGVAKSDAGKTGGRRNPVAAFIFHRGKLGMQRVVVADRRQPRAKDARRQ